MVEGFCLGDKVTTRKPHACGGNRWTVIRIGADVKLKCEQCGRIVMLELSAAKKAVKSIDARG